MAHAMDLAGEDVVLRYRTPRYTARNGSWSPAERHAQAFSGFG